MRLYSRLGATALDHAGTHYDAEPDGSFLLPEDVALQLVRFHVNGAPAWEDELQRQARLIQEEDARRRDPRTLLEAVERITQMAAGPPPAAAPTPAPEVPAVSAELVSEPDTPAEPAAAVVRAWAKEQGIDVPAKGKVPQDVVDAYKRAG